jgi:outer membrane protein TolC
MLAPLVALVVAAAQPAQPTPAPGGAPLHGEPRSTVDPASKTVLAGAAGPVLTLDAALREAEARNTTLQAARARLDQARAQIGKAWSAQLPQVSASANFTHNSTESTIDLPVAFTVRDTGAPTSAPGGGLPGTPTNLTVASTQTITATLQPRNQAAAQIDATQALFAPSVWYSIAAARLGRDAAEESTEATRREVAYGVAQVYYASVALKKTIEVNDRQLAIALDHEKDAQVRYDAGAVPKIALLRAQIDRTRAEQDLRRAQNAYVASRVAIATFLERTDTAFEVELPPLPALPADLDALEEGAPRERPDVRAAAIAVDVQEESRKATKATYLPVIGAFGRYQVTNASGFTGSETAWAIGLSASWNLFDGGLREAQLRETAGRIAEADATLRGAELRARDDVRRARLDYESAEANRTKAQEERRLAQENQRLVEVNFRAGAATYLEVSDANGALTTAEITLVTESLNAALAALRMLQSAGRYAVR